MNLQVSIFVVFTEVLFRQGYVPKRQPQQGTNTFGLYPDKAGGPPTHPLRYMSAGPH